MTDLFDWSTFGQRSSSFRFDLLDQSNSYLGVVDIDQSSVPVIENNINRTIKRRMYGLKLPPATTDSINTLSDRIRPVMIMQDGTEYPLGVFLFADASRTLQYSGSAQFTTPNALNYTTDSSMSDQLLTLDQNTNGVNFYPPGHSIYDALVQQLEAGGVLEYEIEESTAVIRGSNWVVWPTAERRLTVINDLLRMGGYYSLYFDNNGVAQAKLVPDLDATPATFVYGPNKNVLRQPPPVETDDLLDAPNRYVVINTAFTDNPVWGAWDIPSSAPNSYANRGFYVVKQLDIQGVESNSEARRAAKAEGQADYSTYRWVNFSTPIDPRHDTYDILEWRFDKFREQSWSFPCREGSDMDHEIRRIWAEDDEPDEEVLL